MRNFTLLCIALASPLAFGQITYLSTDFASAGETYNVSSASNFALMNFAATGPGHNWDYSGLTAQSQASAGWQDPNDSGYKLTWCLTHFYLFNCNNQFNAHFKLSSQVMDDISFGNYAISNIVEHSNVTADAFSNDMRGMTPNINGISLPVAIDYDDPDEIYHFPMVYNDSYVTSGHFNLDMNPVGVDFVYDLAVQRTNTVEGWGSLVTPMGTFSNVLKLKSVIQRTDSFTVSGINIPVPTTMVSYQWFSKDYGIPVLQADGFELFNLFIPVSVTYIDEVQCLSPDAAFSYIPTADYNPETGSANVSFTNLSANYDQADWDFGDGQMASGMAMSHEYDCPGTYQVTMTVTNHACNPATSASLTLPVLVTDSQQALTTEVSLEGNVLTALRDVPGTTYQWMDCSNNEPVPGAESQSFTPETSGDYAVMLNTNGCQALSSCVSVALLSSAEFNAGHIRVVPNPTTGELHLSGNVTAESVEIFNALGMKVADKLDLSGQASGLYIVRIRTEKGNFLEKVIKQ